MDGGYVNAIEAGVSSVARAVRVLELLPLARDPRGPNATNCMQVLAFLVAPSFDPESVMSGKERGKCVPWLCAAEWCRQSVSIGGGPIRAAGLGSNSQV
jgi:hypothetical protein